MSSVVRSASIGTLKSYNICWPQIWNLTIPVTDAFVFAMQYCPLWILLHMQSFPGLCKNLSADMYMTVLHVCAPVSERACTEPTYMQHEYSRILKTPLFSRGAAFLKSSPVLLWSLFAVWNGRTISGLEVTQVTKKLISYRASVKASVYPCWNFTTNPIRIRFDTDWRLIVWKGLMSNYVIKILLLN